ncbi:MAG: lamin tail domain-containing protein [Christensenellales bacterium]|nr:lamin tail domain-containing protein [Christensenellales bacterium]
MATKKQKAVKEQRGALGILAGLLVLIVIIALVSPGQGVVQRDTTYDLAVTRQSDVVLSEVMTANESALMLSDGTLPDWIELCNEGEDAVSLFGWTLMLGGDPNQMYRFPDVRIPAGGYLVVYADNGTDLGTQELHAPFRIPASGDTLTLIDASGYAADRVSVPALGRNQAYCRGATGDWMVSMTSTPNGANRITNEQNIDAATVMALNVVEGDVEVTEVMTRNASYCADENGEFHDYIELHNKSGAPVNLEGWYLSDSRENIARWTFPRATIPAGGYLTVYCSGKEQTDGGALHTSFRLGSEGTDVVLTTDRGETLSYVQVPALAGDQAYSLVDGKWDVTLAPTPGMANTGESAASVNGQIRSSNPVGVVINEVAAASSAANADWIELYNGGTEAVDLASYGLSDNAARPRKWQFPAGTVIQPGQYLGVLLSGQDGLINGQLNADFSLAAEGGYSVSLCQPDGRIIDHVYLSQQYEDISYGRVEGREGFYYFRLATPIAKNDGEPFDGKAPKPEYSVRGGLFSTGDTLNVELSVPAGMRIYYTLDCTDPTESSALYTGPIPITGTTVLRTRVYADGYLESFMDTQSYLFDVQTSENVFVVSLVSDPYNLTSQEAGIMIKGPNATSTYPYGSMNYGANFWMDWEREAHVEIYGEDGEQVLSSGCGIKLHGQYSRVEDQKAFKVIARTKYGNNRFEVPLFSKRPYTEYQSFLLRSSGQDTDKTRMRDAVLSSLARDTSVMYQESEVCVVYLDGEYWGHYNLRERVNPASICQFEGWEGDEDVVDLVKANDNVMQGSNETFAKLVAWCKANDTSTEEAYQIIDSVIDIQNFIEYMAMEIFTGNTDTLNVKRYRNAHDDGRWRWVLFDLDWAFYTDTNSISRWMTPGGMGNGGRTDNTLFIACMKNPKFKDQFLTHLGERMTTVLTTEYILEQMQARYQILEPLLEAHSQRWGLSASQYQTEMKRMVQYAQERPMKLLQYIAGCEQLGLSNDELVKYFGKALEVAQGQ